MEYEMDVTTGQCVKQFAPGLAGAITSVGAAGLRFAQHSIRLPRARRVYALPCLGVVFAALLVSACSGGQTAAKYKSGDQSATSGQVVRWTFDNDAIGALPQGMTPFSGTWVVRGEADAPTPPNALCQTGTAEFPALALSDEVYKDVALATRFKPISGREDQAAGLIFRVQDKDNYYILRANALEGNVNIYRYAAGRRSGIKDASAKVASGQWQTLRAEVVGNRIRGFLNDQLVVEATDDTFAAGKIGLWTKADSVTCFDNVEAGLEQSRKRD